MSAVSEKSVAIIGAGEAGAFQRWALDAFPELRLSAVVDPDEEAARHLAGSTDVFAAVPAMLDAGCVPDIAIICSPSGLHGEGIRLMLSADCDLLVEPPLVITPDEAQELVEFAERRARIVATVSRARLLPQLERARSRIDAGAIGALRRVEINVAHKRDARHGWRSDPELAGSGALHELGPDALDTAELLLGPVRQIRMTAADRLQEGSVEDAALLETTHDWDRRALLHVSWNEAPDRPLARCTGDLGEIEVGPERSALRRGRDHEELLGGPVDRRMATQAVLGRFLMQRLDPDPISDPAAATIEWLHAAARSLHEGRWQTT